MSHHQVTQDTAEVGLMRMIGGLGLILPSLALIQVLANSRDYRQPAVVIAVWLAVLGVAAWLLPRLRLGRLTAGETVMAIALATAAVAVSGATRRSQGAPGSVDLAILGTVWLLALVVMCHASRVWIPGALIIFAVHGVLLIRGWGLNSLSLSQLEGGGYVIAAILMAFAALRPALASYVTVAARRSSLASRSAAERAAAAAIQQERQSRLAVLEQEALPLLRGIADGTLDPTSDEVRDQCARHAAVLRHSLTTQTRDWGELVAGLEPALRAARSRGLLITVQLLGDPGVPQPPVARAVLATVDTVLSSLAPGQVTLTALASGNDIELYLTFSGSLDGMPDLTPFGHDLPRAARWHAAVTEAEEGRGCLEISWRRCGAA